LHQFYKETFSLFLCVALVLSASVSALFVRSVPGVSIGYQKHLLSLKVMTSQTEQVWPFTGGFGQNSSQWVKHQGQLFSFGGHS